ncbi:response regulator [Heliophilum fasciatum]|uniref:response regulator n=1 Tax=Heliophilum fasciatum TaxID=35700 RepID=UPI00104F6A65|nr:response regulator [Heliophilum fasciatum]MCW2276983.1 CheY-like chemotaxis protein [Heliophilum fasciatum]
MATILICDDNKSSILLVSKLIHQLGHVTIHAANGVEALAATNKYKIDVIILDLYMPILDGKSTIKRLKGNSSTSKIPIIVVSGTAEKSDVIETMALGVNGFILKPISPVDLLSRVAKILANCPKHRQGKVNWAMEV